MDPITAIGLIASIAQILNGIRLYGSAVKDCKQEVVQLRSELFALKGALEHLDWTFSERRDAKLEANQPQTTSGTNELGHKTDQYSHLRNDVDVSQARAVEHWTSTVTLLPTSESHESSAFEVEATPINAVSERASSPLADSIETQQALQDAAHTLGELSKALNAGGSSKAGKLITKVLWPLKRDEVLKYARHLERLKTYFILVTTIDNASATREVYHEVLNLKDAVQQSEAARCTKDDETLRRNAIEWLSPCSAQEFQKLVLKVMLRGTGNWFLDEQYNSWLSGYGPPILWLRGKPGSGKTTLVSACIDKMQLAHDNRPFGYFYCSVGDHASQDIINVFGSFVEQLCNTCPQWWPKVDAMYNEAMKNSRSAMKRSEITDLIDLIVEITNAQPMATYLVLDAPNESIDCDEIIEKMLELSLRSKIRTMIASTEDLAIQPKKSKDEIMMVVDMRSANVQKDIMAYVETCLLESDRLRGLPNNLRMDIKYEIISRSDGSFRWAQCQIESFAHAKSAKQIRQALKHVPRTLEETYLMVLKSIEEDDKHLVRRMLMWLSFGVRAMSLDELAEAAVLTPENEEFDPDDRLLEPLQFVKSCRSLVRFNSETKYCTLAHSSVNSYLQSSSLRNSTAAFFYMDYAVDSIDITSCCIKYIALPAFASGYCSELESDYRRSEWPLLDYASTYWTIHLRSLLQREETSKLSQPVIEMLMRFFGTADYPKGGNFGAWFQTVFPEGPPDVWTSKPLYTAARSGLIPIVQAILASEGTKNLETPGGRRLSTPLHVAATYGRYEVVKLLLDSGANPNERNIYGESGLQWAQYYGRSEVVRLLLDYGADIERIKPEIMTNWITNYVHK